MSTKTDTKLLGCLGISQMSIINDGLKTNLNFCNISIPTLRQTRASCTICAALTAVCVRQENGLVYVSNGTLEDGDGKTAADDAATTTKKQAAVPVKEAALAALVTPEIAEMLQLADGSLGGYRGGVERGAWREVWRGVRG